MNGSNDDSAVSRYLDGEMSPPERETFELRVAGDRELARTVEAERLIRTAVKIDRSRYASPSVASSARFEQLVSRIPKRPPMSSYLRWLLGGSGLTIVAVTALLLTARPERPQQPAPGSGPAAVEAPASVDAGPEALEPGATGGPDAPAARNDSTSGGRQTPSSTGTPRSAPAGAGEPSSEASSEERERQRRRATSPADSTHSERTQVEIKLRTPEIKQNP